MKRVLNILAIAAMAGLLCAPAAAADKKKPTYTKAPGADLKQPIIWGAAASNPDGFELSFGGISQRGDDPRPHTRIRQGDGEWKDIAEELQKKNPLQEFSGILQTNAAEMSRVGAVLRRLYFGQPSDDVRQKVVRDEVLPVGSRTAKRIVEYIEQNVSSGKLKLDDYQLALVEGGGPRPERMKRPASEVFDMIADEGATPETIEAVLDLQRYLEQSAEMLAPEPGGRCLSPIVWEPKSKVFVLFRGDHLDFLRNDLWVFDPAKMRWEQKFQDAAPAPRANHTLKANGDGTITVSGGYTYYNDIWYMGPPYEVLQDGEWTYDLAANKWTAPQGETGVPSDSRTYRGKQFDPMTFVKAEKPDRAANEKRLAGLADNTWEMMNPPVTLKMNRDWGSACIAPEFDVLLRWSGGHSAHGGSDVPMYHFATNRWELPFPVELPLGQTYSNTGYPNGYNLNRRPWVSGHTYRNFRWDPVGKVLVFTGHNPWSYLFSPAAGDWVGRSRKPDAMNYGGSFYTLTLATAGERLYAWGGRWGNSVSLHLWQPEEQAWQPQKLTGAKLPGPKCDGCCLVYDSKRDRLLFFLGGKVWAMDCKTNELAELSPKAGNGSAGKIGFWRELVYVPDSDMVVVLGQVLRPGDPKTGPIVNLAYDCAADTWVGLQFEGKHPIKGRDVSAGVAYDAKRKLAWVTDTNGQVWAIRVNAKSAKRVELE